MRLGFIGLITLLGLLTTSHGQTVSNKGRDFWLTFPPNYHSKYNDPVLQLRDSLCIYIVTESPTTGTITYRDRKGDTFSTQFTTSSPGEIYTFRVTAIDHELEGFNCSGTLVTGSQNETIAPQTFHITADADVAIFALSQAETTSDAALILPTAALGTHYFVMSYNSDGRKDFRGNLTGQSTPSEFAVVAAEDDTKITIRPSMPTRDNSMATQTKTLKRGDAYLVQANITENNPWGDLTGTEITSDKPIAVFGGHQRATIPIRQVADLFSRDMLFEQMPPVDTWGTLHIVGPFAPPKNPIDIGSDLFRVVAAYDNTSVDVNGVNRAVLLKGQNVELPLTAPAVITSSRPVLVAEFKKTSGDRGDATRMGDPFMVIVPPREQYLPSYRCMNIQAYYPASGGSNSNPRDTIVYGEHYLSVVIPSRSLGSLRIDGKPADTSHFVAVPTSAAIGLCLPMKAGWTRVGEGTHDVHADEPFGLVIYGYGIANSYGYTGGISLEKGADVKPLRAAGAKRLCAGDSVQISATGGKGGYQWQPAATLSCADCPNPIAKPMQTTTYHVASFSAGDCPAFDSVTVEVSVVSANAGADTTVCTGGSAQFVASGGVSYRWFPPFGLSCTDCPNPVVTPTAGTTYIVSVTNSDGCMANDSVVVNISIPTADAGRDSIICKGDSVQLSASGGVQYQWFPSVGLSCTNCPAPLARPLQTITYHVRATNAYGCTAEDSMTIKVNDMQAIVNTADSVCAGGSVQLSAGGGMKYQWSPPDGLSCTDCPNPVATPEHTRTYTVTVDNGSGCITIQNVRVAVRECSPAVLQFGRTLSCDEPRNNIKFVNREDTAIRFYGLKPIDLTAAAQFLLEYPVLPAIVTPGDSVVVGVVYLADGDASSSARYRIITSADSARECIVGGTSYTVPTEFTIVAPDTATPGDMRVQFSVLAHSAFWEQAEITDIVAEVIYKTDYFIYDDSVNTTEIGAGMPAGWAVSVASLAGGDSTVLTITGHGYSPIARNCDVFRLTLGVLLGGSEYPSARLRVGVGQRQKCVRPEAAGDSLQIHTCALPIRFVEGNGEHYYLRVSPLPALNSTIRVEYGVGLTAPALIQIFSPLGECITTLAAGRHTAGEYRIEIPAGMLTSGTYFCRMNSGAFGQSVPLIVVE